MFVAASAGNAGPGAGTANHLSPWVTTVAASTQTREFASTLTLTAGDGDTLTCSTARRSPPAPARCPVVLASAAPYSNAAVRRAGARRHRSPARSSPASAASTRRVEKGFNVLQGGAAGMILYNPTLADIETDNHWLPTVHLRRRHRTSSRS